MKTIVLTGGPCAGKTSALARIVQVFTNRGFAVYTLPEAATLFNQAGVNFLTTDQRVFLTAEKALLHFQIQLEDHFANIAAADQRPALLVCDRGTMDIAAYMPPTVWQAILDEEKMNPVELRDKRYDAVIHMCTAAKGAEEFYTLTNNNSRTEPPEVARQIDDKLIDAWTGHPHLRVVGNKDVDFNGKLDRVIAEIAAVLGVPEPIETERKFLVDMVGSIPPVGNESEIFQTYLRAHDGVEQRLRKRGENGHYVYFLTEKQKLAGAQRIEFERQITPSEYLEYINDADPERITIHKRRRCFVWENQYFELDTFINPPLPHQLLELEGLPTDKHVSFPPFLKILGEVTEDPRYYNANIARKDQPTQ
ncbi:MAG: AAA family ATPase [Bacteroidales bacterium]|nr:AAA family ATPase [Bacteroidales bacterium]